jgi:acyl dehydratase/putative sterol carrier protein
MNELDSERTGIAAEALGCMRTPFEIAVAYSQEREQFGRPISRFEAISFKVADMAVKMRAARLLMISAARMIQDDIPCTKEATIAKLYASEVSVECCDMAIQICGGAGYVQDYYPLERFYRDARLGTIGGGTSEILRFLIQREVYIESKRGPSVQISQDVDAIDFDTLMASVPNGFRPDRAEGVSAVIRFSFDDTDSWLLNIENQKCTIEKGDTANPKMTVKTDSTTWRDILLGKLDALQGMMTEKVVIDTDDMELLMKFARMFKFTPEILQGVPTPTEHTTEKAAAPASSKFELGKSLDEIEVGEKAESSMIVSDEHIELYAQMSGDYNALHMDDDYAATTMFGKRIAHGPIGGALVARVIGTQLPGLGTLAFNMKVSFKAPVYPGDEIRAVVEVTEKVPDSNLCRLTFDVFNEDGVVVMDGYANVMPPIKE